MKFIRPSAFLSLMLVFVGCATTPQSRIDREPELFASFPPEVRELVSKGQVQIGFEPDMVRLALGEPDRRVIRQSASDDREIWYYEGRYSRLESHEIHDQSRFLMPGSVIYFDHTRETIYDRMQLDFVDGKLVAIEQLER